MLSSKLSKYGLCLILLLGWLIRLGFILIDNPATVRFSGGDEFWYMVNGVGMFSPEPMGQAYGFPYAANAIGVAPLYLLITGFVQLFFSLEPAIQVIWLIQSIISIFSCYLSYRIAWRLSDDKRVGYLAATVLAFSPSFSFEVTRIATESFYIFFNLAAISLYAEWLIRNDKQPKYSILLFVGTMFGLATLTRAISLLFPIGVLIHLGLILGLRQWRKFILAGLVLIVSYSCVVGTWTAYNWFNYQRFIIGSNQFMPAVWRGAVENDGSPSENDELLGEQTATEQATEIISSDPLGYVQRRGQELLDAYLQPHGTISFGSQNLKAMAIEWLKNITSLQAFWDLISGEGFWPKLIIYVWHYTSLIAGLVGMWLTRKNWRISLVLIGFIAYTTLIHMISLALPRYVFPTYPIWWIFAAVSLIKLWDMFRTRQTEAES